MKRTLLLLLCFVTCTLSSYAQQSIKGTVTESGSGDPLIGVTIAVKGSTQGGAMTDANGSFSIKAPDNSTLVFRFLGMLTKEVKTTPSMGNLKVIMEPDAMSMEEVVVVGYGSVKKVNLTGAVASVSGKELADRPLLNVGQGLQGVVPNLIVTPGNSRPGKGSDFNIRGVTSLNGGSPLILVDGVQMDINLINPDDVESISVLKDAASSAIYGARAAYGVLLVTTRQGKLERKPQVSLRGTVVFNTPTRLPDPMNSVEYMNYMNLVETNSGGSPMFSPKIMDLATAYYNDPINNSSVYWDRSSITNNRYTYVGNTDWVNETIRPYSINQMYNIDINGGSKNTTYYASFGIIDQGGLMKLTNDTYQRYNANVNVSTQITKWLQMSAKAMYSHAVTEGPSGGKYYDYNSGVLGYDLNPLLPVRHPDGHFSGQGSITNGAALAEQGGRTNIKTNDLWLTGSLKATPVKGLTIAADYTFNYYSRDFKRHDRSYQEFLADGSYVMFPHTNPNKVTLNNNADYYTSLNAYIDYTAQWGKHGFTAMAGYNQELKNYSGYGVSRSNLISNDLPYLGLSTGALNASSNNGENQGWGVQGVFFRLKYDFAERYLLEVNGRYDRSSRFPESGRGAFFPSVSAAWRIANEKFMEGARSVLNELKIRASWGQLGNQNIGNFDYLPAFNVVSGYGNTNNGYIFGGNRPVTISAPGLVNPNFTWETVEQIDLGLEFALFDSRLSGSLGWYNRQTKNMLTTPAPLPSVLGASQPAANAADLSTKGWELSLNWHDHIQSCDFSYNVGLVLSDNTTKLTRFDVVNPAIGAKRVGMEWGEIWGYTTDGFFTSQADIDKGPDQSYLYNGKYFAGDVRYKDLNGDGKINDGKGTMEDPGDMRLIGNSAAHYMYGITAGFNWKGLEFQMFWQGVGKADMAPGGNFYGARREVVPFKAALDYWTPENPNARLARPQYNNWGNRQTQTRTLQDASYIRLKSLTVGYSLPSQWMARAKMQKVKIYFTGENLFTFTKLYKDYDPEQANEYGYPLARMFSIGLNITF
ncbi:MAG: TonB-dependent receptor [Mucinivorans sp.]